MQQNSTFEAQSRIHAGIRASDFQIFWELADRNGLDRHAILHELAIDPATFHLPDAVLPFDLTNSFFEVISAWLPRGSFGLELAMKSNALKMAGPMQVAMQNAGTLEQACNFYANFIQTYCPSFEVRIAMDESVERVAIEIGVPGCRGVLNLQGTEHFLLFVTRLIARQSSDRVRPLRVSFAHAPLSAQQVYTQCFPCAVHFEQPTNAIHFDQAEFVRIRSHYDPELFELAAYYIQNQYEPFSRGFLPQVRAFMRESLSSRQCTPAAAARRLGLTPRTLQRRLGCEGTSFEAIKDEVRRDFALRYLDQQVPLIEIASRLGYSESSVLTRSCNRWFSSSPRKLRRDLRERREAAAGS